LKTITNKTHQPLRVPLPRGKVLHLGPNATGEVSHKQLDHPPFKALVEAGARLPGAWQPGRLRPLNLD